MTSLKHSAWQSSWNFTFHENTRHLIASAPRTLAGMGDKEDPFFESAPPGEQLRADRLWQVPSLNASESHSSSFFIIPRDTSLLFTVGSEQPRVAAKYCTPYGCCSAFSSVYSTILQSVLDRSLSSSYFLPASKHCDQIRRLFRKGLQRWITDRK